MVGVAAEVQHLVRMLQPGHQPGIEHGRFAHAGGAVVEDDRPGAWVDHEVVELANGVAPAEEHSRLIPGESLETSKGCLGEPVHGRGGQAEQWVVNRLGQAPARVQLGTGGHPQLPGEAPVIRGVHGRGCGPVQVPGPEIGLGRRSSAGHDPAAGRLVGGAKGLARGELGIEGRGEF